MRRSMVCALVLVALGCGSSSPTGTAGDAAATGGTTGTGGQSSGGTGGSAGATGDAADATALDTGPPLDVGAPSDTAMAPDASQGADVLTSAARDLCARGCNTAASLRCPQSATCVADCVSQYETTLASRPQCRAAIDTLLACGAARPLPDWQCGADGTEELKPGVCDTEGQAAIACILGA